MHFKALRSIKDKALRKKIKSGLYCLTEAEKLIRDIGAQGSMTLEAAISLSADVSFMENEKKKAFALKGVSFEANEYFDLMENLKELSYYIEDEIKIEEYKELLIELEEQYAAESMASDGFYDHDEEGGYREPEELTEGGGSSFTGSLFGDAWSDTEEDPESSYERNEEVDPEAFYENVKTAGYSEELYQGTEQIEDEAQETKKTDTCDSKEGTDVRLPEYNEYLDISSADTYYEKKCTMFDIYRMRTYLDMSVDTAADMVEEIEQKKFHMAYQMLEGAEILSLREQLARSYETLKNKTTELLAKTYGNALSDDYDRKARQYIKPFIAEYEQELEQDNEKYIREAEEEKQRKLGRFEQEQKNELDRFIKQQEINHNEFLLQLDEKLNERIGIIQDNIRAEVRKKQEKELISKKKEFIEATRDSLLDYRRKVLTNISNELDKASGELDQELIEQLNNINEIVDSKIPEWEQEIISRRNEEEKRQEKITKQKELELQEKALMLEEKKLSIDQDEQLQQIESVEDLKRMFTETMQSQNKMFADLVDKTLFESKRAELEERERIINQKSPGKHGNDKRHSFLYGLLSGVVGIVLIMLMVMLMIKLFIPVQATASQHSNEVVGSSQVAEPDQTRGSIGDDIHSGKADPSDDVQDPVESAETGNKGSEADKDLKELLRQQKYHAAMELYDQPEHLDTIETALYENKELELLKAFNASHETTFGAFDEALLQGVAKDAAVLFNQMDEEEIQLLQEAGRIADFTILMASHYKTDIELGRSS